MKPGYICVAGIDLQSKAHVRPVLAGGRLGAVLLKRAGGPFDVAVVVDLRSTQPQGNAPETEDHLFESNKTAVVDEMTAKKFWKLLKSLSESTLTAIFGKELKARSNGCAVNEGTGSASLGCLLPAKSPQVFVNSWGKIRTRVFDGTFDVDLSVTDLRLYHNDQQTPRSQVVADVQRRIEKGVDVILAVGLARAFRATGDTARRHWLQVNNIHLGDNPVWQAT